MDGDDERPLHPALADLTPEEAAGLVGNDDAVERWLKRKGLTQAPPRFFGVIARLAFQVEEKQFDIAVARQRAARRSPANRRRRDLACLRFLVEKAGPSLPPRLRSVGHLCIVEGLSIAEAAKRLEIAPSTVRTHIKRLREIVRRNPHVLVPRD